MTRQQAYILPLKDVFTEVEKTFSAPDHPPSLVLPFDSLAALSQIQFSLGDHQLALDTASSAIDDAALSRSPGSEGAAIIENYLASPSADKSSLLMAIARTGPLISSEIGHLQRQVSAGKLKETTGRLDLNFTRRLGSDEDLNLQSQPSGGHAAFSSKSDADPGPSRRGASPDYSSVWPSSNEHLQSPVCPSSDPHNPMPDDLITHFFSCVKISERLQLFDRLDDDSKGRIENAVRRVAYLRGALMEEETAQECLVSDLKRSMVVWRQKSKSKPGDAEDDPHNIILRRSGSGSGLRKRSDVKVDPEVELLEVVGLVEVVRPTTSLARTVIVEDRLSVEKFLSQEKARRQNERSRPKARYIHLASNNTLVSQRTPGLALI